MFLSDYQCNGYVQCLFVTFKNHQSLVKFDRQTTFIITTLGEILIYIFKTIYCIHCIVFHSVKIEFYIILLLFFVVI